MGWVHQTYAEFLAAWYVTQHELELPQILSLILHPDDRVIPQLHETTAWLASMNPDVFQTVMKIDPDVLLLSDLTIIDQLEKSQLVDELLRLHDQEKLRYEPWNEYDHLTHKGLPNQLESYICDQTKHTWSRLLAIDIARDCNTIALQTSLVDVALDPTQEHQT